MASVRVLVLRAAGINCDEETMHCWQLAGAAPTLMHLNELCANPGVLDDYQIVTVPGGFSYGDDISAGQIFALRIITDLLEPLRGLVARGGGILGICNGFQVLIKTGLLDGGKPQQRDVTITWNEPPRFTARWVRLRVETDRCPFLTVGDTMEMPVENAEGRVVVADPSVARRLEGEGRVAVRYVDGDGRTDVYPANPNGSVSGIAGLCDATGRVFGLMPHPDRYFARTHHPGWTRGASGPTPDGLNIFSNAVRRWS